MTSKHFTSLSLNKKKPQPSKEVQNVFGDEESDEDTKSRTPAERFHSKFGNLKARDDRAVQNVLAENPDIYDYDAAYDDIKERRARMEEEEEASRKADKKARYTDKLLEAKKKRDMERLLRDERKQEKERVAEGDEFKDKEVFVTGAYRKQLEKTVKFRKELEESDRVDDVTSVSGQKMWRENFGKKMLEDKLKGRFLDTDEEPKKEESSRKADKSRGRSSSTNEEPKKNVEKEESYRKVDKSRGRSSSTNEEPKKKVEKEESYRKADKSKGRSSSTDEESKKKQVKKEESYRKADKSKGRSSSTNEESKKKQVKKEESYRETDRSKGRSSSRNEETKKKRVKEEESYREADRYRGRSSSRNEEPKKKRVKEEETYREADRSRSRSSRTHEEPKKKRVKEEESYREADKKNRMRRMDKIREILKQRNGPKQIDEARERFLARQSIYELVYKEIVPSKLITPSVVSERLKICVSLATAAFRQLHVKGLIKCVDEQENQQVYTRVTKGDAKE